MSLARHRQAPVPPELIKDIRIEILETQVQNLSISNATAGIEQRAQAAIIRRKNAEEAALRHELDVRGVVLVRLLLSYIALARVRDTSRPARVLDTGTPGVEVAR